MTQTTPTWNSDWRTFDSHGAEQTRFIKDQDNNYIAEINWERYFSVSGRSDEDGEAVAKLIISAPAHTHTMAESIEFIEQMKSNFQQIGSYIQNQMTNDVGLEGQTVDLEFIKRICSAGINVADSFLKERKAA